MEQDVELIPLLELPTVKDESGQTHPSGSPLTNPLEWDIYQETRIKKNYQHVGKPVRPGVYQYRLLDMTQEDMVKVIGLHTAGIPLMNSCSLFGGYALAINREIVLYPQCCGLLEEINDWKKLLDKSFEPFYLTECHPSPGFRRVDGNVVIDCSDSDEPFFPETQAQIIVNHDLLKAAVEKLISDLEMFSRKIDELSELFRCRAMSDILIWGNNK